MLVANFRIVLRRIRRQRIYSRVNVGFQSLRAAAANPADTLRNE